MESIRTITTNDWTLEIFDTYKTDSLGKCRLAYKFSTDEEQEDVIFEGDDFFCSPSHSIDSNETVGAMLTFFSLKPGDTDAEHFEGYNERQKAYLETDLPEELAQVAAWLKSEEDWDQRTKALCQFLADRDGNDICEYFFDRDLREPQWGQGNLFEADGEEWSVMTEEEAEEDHKAYAENYLEDVVMAQIPEGDARKYFDSERWMEDYIDQADRGTDLAFYDGEEHDSDCGKYFLYRRG